MLSSNVLTFNFMNIGYVMSCDNFLELRTAIGMSTVGMLGGVDGAPTLISLGMGKLTGWSVGSLA